MLDVLIIGGGPAGAACAIHLARAGRSVALIEKARFPRRKVCGEFLAPSGVDELRRLGFEPVLLGGREIRRLAIWSASATMQADLPTPAYALTRERLDAALLERARASGALLHQPATALALRRTAGGLVCKGNAHGDVAFELAARTVIAAHGSWLRGALPTQPTRRLSQGGDLFGFQAHFSACRIAGEVALVPLAGGYAGLLDLGGGNATFACCMRRDRLAALRAAENGAAAGEAILRHARGVAPALHAALANARREGAWLAAGPLRPGSRRLHRDGVFTVGNAAGEVQPMIGEGVSLALGCARLLADALLPALEAGAPAEAARAYAAAWRSAFLPRFVAAGLFAAIAMRPAATACGAALLRRAPRLMTLAAGLAQ